MAHIPVFESENEYCLHRADVDFWWPHIIHVLKKHDLEGCEKRLTVKCGFNPTYPVFLIDDMVIKFFGHRPYWLNAFNTECAAHEYLIRDNTILAPRILAKGELFSDGCWAYIVSSKVKGRS